MFHFALNPGGFLVLGLAETVGSFGDLFELANRAHKIYRRKETREPAAIDVHGGRVAGRRAAEAARRRQSPARRIFNAKRTA